MSILLTDPISLRQNLSIFKFLYELLTSRKMSLSANRRNGFGWCGCCCGAETDDDDGCFTAPINGALIFSIIFLIDWESNREKKEVYFKLYSRGRVVIIFLFLSLSFFIFFLLKHVSLFVLVHIYICDEARHHISIVFNIRNLFQIICTIYSNFEV